ncbi:hypothetical protein F2Q69_00021960 [Brassica cretica]|uniref:Uncharacterized protein n=1 Tax=Brassica cretica TaxID=69181 RepID=A0A8S9QM73_BRACR|nr:hypothetical protein F2Q69_00021960 [Brassica cretica]
MNQEAIYCLIVPSALWAGAQLRQGVPSTPQGAGMQRYSTCNLSPKIISPLNYSFGAGKLRSMPFGLKESQDFIETSIVTLIL